MAHSIRSESDPAGKVIVVTGEADATAASALDDALRGAVVSELEEGEGRTIVVDLTETDFADSRTIAVLTKWAEQFAPRGWRLPLVCTDPNMLRLFTLIGLDDVFEFHETREAAFSPKPGGSNG